MFYINYVRLCNKVNKSPSAAAEEMGFQRSVVTRWSKGTIPRTATLQKIADYFGVPVSELLDEKENAPTLEGERIPHAALREYMVGPGIRIQLDADAKVTEETLIKTVKFLSKIQEGNDR